MNYWQGRQIGQFSYGLTVVAASVAVIGRPTVTDILAGNREDVMVSLWYVISLVGVIGGMVISDVDSLDIVLGKLTGMAGLLVNIIYLVSNFVIDMSWRLRLIHGGYDAKTLMWVAILILTGQQCQ